MIEAIWPGILAELALNGVEIVERGDQHVVECALGHSKSTRNRSGRVDIAELLRLRLHAHQRAVVQSVVGAFELDDLVAACSRTRKANRMHRGFGAA